MKKLFFYLLTILFATHVAKAQNTETGMEHMGLIRVKSLDASIREQLVFATNENILGKQLYTDLSHAYLHPSAAAALVKANKALKRLFPDYSLLVLDAARPLSAQTALYAAVQGTDKNIFVADPRTGGEPQNYGLGVDVTILDANHKPLDMGTQAYDFSHLSGQAVEYHGDKLSEEIVSNRQLLRRIMAVGGFRTERTMWWHFNFRTRSEAKANFQLIK